MYDLADVRNDIFKIYARQWQRSRGTRRRRCTMIYRTSVLESRRCRNSKRNRVWSNWGSSYARISSFEKLHLHIIALYMYRYEVDSNRLQFCDVIEFIYTTSGLEWKKFFYLWRAFFDVKKGLTFYIRIKRSGNLDVYRKRSKRLEGDSM